MILLFSFFTAATLQQSKSKPVYTFQTINYLFEYSASVYLLMFCQSGLDISKMIIYKRRQEAKQKRREKRAERRAKRQEKREVLLWKHLRNTLMDSTCFLIFLTCLLLRRDGRGGQRRRSLDWWSSQWRKRPARTASGTARAETTTSWTRRSRAGPKGRTGQCLSSRPLLEHRRANPGGNT